MSPLNDQKKTVLAECMLLLVTVMWGMNPPVIKLGLQHIPPLPYNVARMLVGSVVAVLVLWLSGRYRRPTRGDAWRFMRASIFGFFLFQILFAEGIDRTTAGNAAFMCCLLPLFVLLINRICGFDTIGRAVLIGIACSMAGIVLIVLGAGRELSMAGKHLFGALLLLGSQAGYAYYTVFSRELLDRYSTYQVTASLMVITTVLLLLVSLPAMRGVAWPDLPAQAWGSIAFSGVFGLCLANFLWIWGAGVIGTARASVFNNLTPVFAVVVAYFLLGETFGVLQAAGAALVMGGVYVTRRRGRFPGWRAKGAEADGKSPGSS
ncbi:MAG: DMT family transporter [Candidatus Accumulibacter sp.]|jgi:drug/metabolite transporter (DMT)-like permease|nr:DMT family transporter [Accumulibacter sp.]